jgi:hypothetical protein
MSAAIRLILTLTLLLFIARVLAAQETATTTTTGTTAASAAEAAATASDATDTTATADTTDTTGTATTTTAEKQEYSIERTRNEFRQVLNRYANQMGTLLAIEPSLLTNEEFLKGHPDLAEFIAAHPEVAQHPEFYVDGMQQQIRPRSAFGEALEGMIIFGIFIFIAAVLAWLVRTIIEQKRWSRLSQQQAEVHNKILDRFGNSEELMQYIKTPAGSKFLESAPIPLHTESPSPMRNSPLARVMWSIQLGVIVAAGAFGLILVSFRFPKETAADLFAMGTIGFCIGAGFIASALISMFMSRRLGVWQGPADEADVVK